jgi:16S rRNA (cytosine967-C5)-methyltransferase
VNVRAQAASLIAPVLLNKQSLTLPADSSASPLCAELCYGTLRWLPRLQLILNDYLSKPLRNKDCDIRALLLIGLYQIDKMRIPDHAAVAETVQATRQLDKPWAAKLVNAILRRVLRDQSELENKYHNHQAFQLAHPQWLIDEIQSAWPTQSHCIFEAGNSRPPMTLRINLSRTSRPDYLALLEERGIDAFIGNICSTAITLSNPVPVSSLPGFSEGLVSVQDEAAQLCGELLAAQPGDHILDACAAPGGKASHLLEIYPDINLLACDIDSERLLKVEENLSRLKLNAECKALDAGNPDSWNETDKFDRILLDAPCSGTGVIRRHPDIKCLRRAEDINRYVVQQNRLLDTLWQPLQPGGLLLYATCSIMPQENAKLVESFLGRCDDADSVPIQADWGIVSGPGRQLLPDKKGTDGFYFALLKKTGNSLST